MRSPSLRALQPTCVSVVARTLIASTVLFFVFARLNRAISMHQKLFFFVRADDKITLNGTCNFVAFWKLECTMDDGYIASSNVIPSFVQ